MEGDNVQVDDNCSQIEKAFKRMKVGTSRCSKKNHHPIYQPNHQYHQQQHQHKSHPEPLNQLHLANQVSPSSITGSPYLNQISSFNCRVIPKSVDDENNDDRFSMDKGNFFFSPSFSTPISPSLSSSSSSSSPSSSTSSSLSSSSSTSPSCCYSSMGMYRDTKLFEGQSTDSYHHQQRQNNNNNNSNYHLNQSSDHNTKYEDGPPAEPDVSVEELAAYLDVQLYIPRKMSYMAELMYT